MPSGVPIVEVQVTSPAKPWWKSKTVWFNVLVLMLTAAETQLNVLQPLLPLNVYALVAFALPAFNVGLRFISAQALAFKALAQAGATAQPAPPPGPAP